MVCVSHHRSLLYSGQIQAPMACDPSYADLRPSILISDALHIASMHRHTALDTARLSGKRHVTAFPLFAPATQPAASRTG